MQTFKTVSLALIVIGLLTSFIPNSLIKNLFNQAEQQTQLMLTDVAAASQAASSKISPRSLNAGGELQLVGARDWTSGFFSGELWYLYEYTGKKSGPIRQDCTRLSLKMKR